MTHLCFFERFDLGTLDSGEQSLPFGLLIATTHIPNNQVNINSAVVFVKPWRNQATSVTTDITVQTSILHLLRTLPPNKKGSKWRFSWP